MKSGTLLQCPPNFRTFAERYLTCIKCGLCGRSSMAERKLPNSGQGFDPLWNHDSVHTRLLFRPWAINAVSGPVNLPFTIQSDADPCNSTLPSDRTFCASKRILKVRSRPILLKTYVESGSIESDSIYSFAALSPPACYFGTLIRSTLATLASAANAAPIHRA